MKKRYLNETYQGANRLLKEKIAQLAASKKEIQDKIQLLKDKKDKKLAQKATITNDILARKTFVNAVVPKALQTIQTMHDGISRGIPYQKKERLGMLAKLRQELSSNEQTKQIDVLKHLLSFSQNELQLSRNVEFCARSSILYPL